MKISPLGILLNKNFKPDKRFYFISGNEVTLMEKIKSKIIEKMQRIENIQTKNIDTINGFVDEVGLFENKNVILVDSLKGIDKESLDAIKGSQNSFIFIQENSQKIKKIKNLFGDDKDSYLIDCYELDRNSKIKILNEYIELNKAKVSEEIYWFLIDKLDNRYVFFENNLTKILDLESKEITLDNIKKLFVVDESSKQKIFFNLLKKNKEIVNVYRDKIINKDDVSDLYYYSKFFCQLIVECESEQEYSRKIPLYLFKEKNFLVDIYRKYNSKKKRLLLNLLLSTENNLRKQSELSVIFGLRFLLNIKKITIS